MILDTDWIPAIDKRVSRRTYVKTEIANAKTIKITNLITDINEELGFNIQFIHNADTVLNGFKASYGLFSNVSSFIALVANKSIDDYKKKIGFYGEALVLECTALNIGTCWVGGTFNKTISSNLVTLKENEELICLIAVGIVNEESSFKEKMFKKLAKNKKDFYYFLTKSEGDLPNWAHNGIVKAIKAPSAINKKPVGYKYSNGKMTAFTTFQNKGFEEIDLGISMLHFQLGALEKGVKGNWETKNNSYIFKLEN